MGASGHAVLSEQERSDERVELVGELDRSLDDRGRLSMPTAFRSQFTDGAVIMRWPGPCVAVMPVEEYRVIEDAMRTKQRDQLGDARARQAFNALANHSRLDASGRLFIPEELRGYAGFDRELVVVGQRIRLELWARSGHEAGAEERWQALVAHISAEAL